MYPQIGSVIRAEPMSESSRTRSLRMLELCFVGPFLAYLALKKAPVTQTESRVLLGVSGAIMLVNTLAWLDAERDRRISETPQTAL